MRSTFFRVVSIAILAGAAGCGDVSPATPAVTGDGGQGGAGAGGSGGGSTGGGGSSAGGQRDASSDLTTTDGPASDAATDMQAPDVGTGSGGARQDAGRDDASGGAGRGAGGGAGGGGAGGGAAGRAAGGGGGASGAAGAAGGAGGPDAGRRLPAGYYGDFDGDHKSDIALTGGSGWASLPIATSMGDGQFAVTNNANAQFATWAQTAGAYPLSGDFNGDGKSDIALIGGVNWQSIPITFTNGLPFNVTNMGVTSFPGWAQVSGAKGVSGDFNGDGKTDLALTGGVGWNSVPVAFSVGDGNFTITNQQVSNIPGWAQVAGALPVAGDFDGDGRDDIALVGGSRWMSVPIAFSIGDGSFRVTNATVASIPGWAQVAGAKPVSGDFNGDGRGDIALVGGTGWNSQPLALSVGDGSFTVTNTGIADFAGWAQVAGAKAVSGDYNGDGATDLALVGGQGWASQPVAFSNKNGSFTVSNAGITSLASWAMVSGARPVSGH